MQEIGEFFKKPLQEFQQAPAFNVWNRIAYNADLVQFNKYHFRKHAVQIASIIVAAAAVVAVVLYVVLTHPTLPKLPFENTILTDQTAIADTSITHENRIAQVKEEIPNPKPEQVITPEHLVDNIINRAGDNPLISTNSTTKPINYQPVTIDNSPKLVVEKKEESKPLPPQSQAVKEEETNESANPQPAKNITEETYEIFVPNAFSPDGDGINELFEIVPAFEPTNYYLFIFDKTGQQIFKSSDYRRSWNGEYNGSQMPVGTYVYLLKYTDPSGEKHTKRGNIYLRR